MLSITKLMMILLHSELTKTEPDRSLFDNVSEEDWMNLYRFSKRHDLAHLTGDAVLKNHLLDQNELSGKFKKQLVTSVYRFQLLQRELQQIKAILTEANIPFIPLKGSVMRTFYPEPWMRTSCDIDILIHESDTASATELFIGKGYTQSGQTSHDISFTSANQVHLELHHTLIEEGLVGKADRLLEHIWEYAKPIGDTAEYAMTDEMFYYYHLAHMAKHLQNGGGCGIRPFLDLWILNHLVPGNMQGRKALLTSGGLDKFAGAANELAECWMEGTEPSPTAKQLEAFILSGGVYGNRENRIVIVRGKKKSKLRYLLSRIWIPYSHLTGTYPNLRGKRILLPFYEIRRWFHLLNKETFKRSRAELIDSAAVPDEQKEQATQMLSDLGLI